MKLFQTLDFSLEDVKKRSETEQSFQFCLFDSFHSDIENNYLSQI